jgi:hypothetical protein
LAGLIETLQGVDWNSRKDEFFSMECNGLEAIESHLQILARWARSLETIYQDNPALPFIREAQVSAQDFISVYSLSLYKNSAASMRTIFESVLYFSYFKDHPIELKSVMRDGFHLSRTQIINYHIKHTENFASIYQKTDLENTLDNMYSDVSNIVHSSQPGVWHQIARLGEKKYDNVIATETTQLFMRTMEIINLLLLCTVTYEEWLAVEIKSRRIFLKGLTPNQARLINKQVI